MPSKWAFDVANVLGAGYTAKAAAEMEWVSRKYHLTVEIHVNGKIFRTHNANWYYLSERESLQSSPFRIRLPGAQVSDDSQSDISNMTNAVTVVVDQINSSWFDPFLDMGSRITWATMTAYKHGDQNIRSMIGLNSAALVRKEKYPLLPHKWSYIFYCVAVNQMVPESFELPPGF